MHFEALHSGCSKFVIFTKLQLYFFPYFRVVDHPRSIISISSHFYWGAYSHLIWVCVCVCEWVSKLPLVSPWIRAQSHYPQCTNLSFENHKPKKLNTMHNSLTWNAQCTTNLIIRIAQHNFTLLDQHNMISHY